jgi:hypothetical protein
MFRKQTTHTNIRNYHITPANTAKQGSLFAAILKKSWLAVLLLLMATQTLSASEWELITRSGDGIAVFRRTDPDSDMFEFKGHGTLDAPIGKVITILQDIALMEKWVEGCSEAKMIKRNYTAQSFDKKINQYWSILYGVNAAPWPISDRDYVLKGRISYDPKRDAAYINLRDVKGVRPEQSGKVRMNFMKVRVTLRPVAKDKKTWIQLYVHVDPAGLIPAWAVNFVTKNVPLQSIRKLKKFVKRNDYDKEMEKLVNHHIEKLRPLRAKYKKKKKKK